MTRHRAPPMSQRQLRSNRGGDPPSSSTPAQPTPAPPTSTSRLTTSSRERCSTCPRTSPTKTTSALSMESSANRRNTPTPTNSKGESANNSPTPTRINSRAGSPKPTLYKYSIKNIPTEFAGHKKFHTLLTIHLLVRNIHKLVVNGNKTAFLITSLPLHDKFANNLIAATGSKTISCCPLKRKREAPNYTGNNPTQKKNLLSVVVKGVDHDIDENDIRDQLDALPLAYKLIWRIKSRKTNKCTNLIRVTTENTNTVDFLLTHGLVLYGKHHQCEPSKPPTPTPLQCSKCVQLGHHVTACPNKPACPKCPQTHAPNKCEAAVSTCLLCGGPHAAWSRSYPSIKTAPITEETPIAPTIVMHPPAVIADPDITLNEPVEPPISAKQTIAFITKILYDLKIHKLIELTTSKILNTRTHINHTGQRIYFTFE
jgi:hypothetical protein